MKLAPLFCAALLASCAPAVSPAALESSVPQLRLPLMPAAPVIDGVIGEDEWSGAGRMERFGRGAPLASQRASFWVGSDGRELFLAVRSETPPGGNLLMTAAPAAGDADAEPSQDDSIELLVAPSPDAAGAQQQVYQAIINARGAIFDQQIGAPNAAAWRGKWRVQNSVKGDVWESEIAIPWSDLGVTDAVLGRSIGLRLGRNWQRSADMMQSEWSPLGGAYATIATMPRVQWQNEAPVVQVLQLQDAPDAPANIRLRLSNPGAAPLRVLAKVDMKPRDSAPTNFSQIVELAASASRELSVTSPAQGAEPIATQIAVTSPDGQTTYYRRDFSWQVKRPGTLWNLKTEIARKFEAKYAYFPSANAMHVRVDLAALPQREGARAVRLLVRRKASTYALAQIAMPPLQAGITEVRRWNLPPLPEGDYELVATVEGTGIAPEVFPFERHKFAWENNKLGTSDIVVPPFTPIAVRGQRVDTVLRRHTMNGLGLWNQVEAAGKPLLKAPMRLEAKIGGRVLAARGAMKITSSKATRAVAQAQWTAGALRGSTQAVWDYDGVMKTTLTLQPGAQKIDSLTLIIPLDDAQMPLLHAATDGIRFNYAGSTPAGKGRVWDGTKAPRNDIIGNYVPYIWLGSAERGLSVFGENDSGWITDDKAPLQEIVRNENGTLELRLNLIQKSSSWKQPRRITLGFQATPVKPMPQNWRLWTIGPRGGVKAPGQYHQSFLGSSFYWGGVTGADDIYPRKGDFSLWGKFAETRKTGKIDRDFLERWLAGYTIPDTPEWQKMRETYRAHINAGFYEMSTQTPGVLVYTNPRGTRLDTPEGRTFMDEWLRQQFPKRDWDFGGSESYSVDPVKSFRDYSAFYWHKMMTTFTEALYWDNAFYVASFDPIVSEAYVRPDGRVQPASSLWNTRELSRRGAVLARELGHENRNMWHMTNSAIAPILGMARSQLSWEYGYTDVDFQDRFSREAIQVDSIGRQFGTAPFVLALIAGSDKARLDHVARTAAGATLTHEIKPMIYSVPLPMFWENYDRMVSFGYGSPQVKVWNYWQRDFPAKISGKTASLLLSKPASALLVVCDWGEGGDFKVKLDTKKLGLAGKLTATDAETSAPLTISAGGEVAFPLKKHDFKVVRITAE